LPKKLVVRSLGELGIVRQLDKGTRGHSMVDQRRRGGLLAKLRLRCGPYFCSPVS